MQISFLGRKGPHFQGICTPSAGMIGGAAGAVKTMNFKNKLANPFVLVAQGFAAGAILFFAMMPIQLPL
jgi:hypothetical protein